MKLYSIDDTLFDRIDTPWKAYFLGWLYADGCMQKDYYRVTLAIQEKDKEILDYFAHKIYGRIDIVRYRKPTCPYSNKHNKNCFGKPQRVFRINNKKICNNLVNMGVIPAKSLILKFPRQDILPIPFLWHFVRGYFEGDGTVRKPRYNHSSDVGILGSYEFLKDLGKQLYNSSITFKISSRDKIGQLSIYGVENLIKFYNLIYKDADFFLKRKKERFDEIISNRDRSSSNNKTSIFNGITYNSRIKRFISRATVNGKRFNIGCFKTEKEAYEARIEFLKINGVYTI